jgi:hypothetical protein
MTLISTSFRSIDTHLRCSFSSFILPSCQPSYIYKCSSPQSTLSLPAALASPSREIHSRPPASTQEHHDDRRSLDPRRMHARSTSPDRRGSLTPPSALRTRDDVLFDAAPTTGVTTRCLRRAAPAPSTLPARLALAPAPRGRRCSSRTPRSRCTNHPQQQKRPAPMILPPPVPNPIPSPSVPRHTIPLLIEPSLFLVLDSRGLRGGCWCVAWVSD